MKTIEYIYIDTNIFVSQNFLEGQYINKLLKFGTDKYIKIILTSTTVGEIKNQFRIKINESFIAYRQYMKSPNAKYLRNVDFGKKVNDYEFSKLKIDDFCKEFNDLFDKKLKDSDVIILPYTYVDSTFILEAYFNQQPPFSGKKEKKLGFPDAFIIENLKGWIKDSGKNLTILTNDEDFSHLKSFSTQIKITNDIIEKYNNINNSIQVLEKKLTNERLETLDTLYNSNSETIIKDIKEYFKDGVLEDESIYYVCTNENVYDVSNLEFTNITNHGFNIKEILNAEEIKIEIIIDVYFSIDVLTDDMDSWVYDSEDKEVYFRHQKDITIEGMIEITLETIVNIIDKNEYQDSIDLNIDSDSYKITVHEPDYY